MTKQRRFTVDLAPDDTEPPMPGEYLRSARATYVVLATREVESRVWCNRWALTVRRLPPGAVVDDGARVHRSLPYRHGEGPLDVFGDPGGD